MDFNKCIFIGKVKGAPQIGENNGVKQAYIKFSLNDRAPGANGQWVDRPMDVELYAKEKKAELIEKYVVDGQELTVECKYLNWEANGVVRHGFQVLNLSFGFKPKTNAPAPSAAPGGPPL